MANVPTSAADVLRRVGIWNREAARMRADLEAQRAELIESRDGLNARIEEISRALDALPAASAAPAEEVAAGTDREMPTAPELVLDVLGRRPNMTGPEIYEAVRSENGGLDKPTVYSALLRLEKRGAIRVTGPRGKKVYSLSHGLLLQFAAEETPSEHDSGEVDEEHVA